MNRLTKLRRREGLTLEDMARILVVQPSTLQRCESGDYDHIPEVEDELRRRLMALGWLDRAESSAAA